MSTASLWFLVMMGGQQYIGPIDQSRCQQAAIALASEGVVCRQAAFTMKACAVDGGPGAYMACPVFDFPQITVKP